jgi:nucleoid-associated protein YgaU
VTLLDGDRELAVVDVDASGQWAAIVDRPPLAAGAHDLRLVQRQQGGETVQSDRTITVIVPQAPATVAAAPVPSPVPPPSAPPPASSAQPPSSVPPASQPPSVTAPAPAPGTTPGAAPAPPAQPLVLSTPRAGGPSTVIQAPGGPDTLARSGKLVLGAVDYDEQGRLTVTGQGPPGTTMRLYVDNQAVGDATVGADGQWSMQPAQAVAVGKRTVRVDQLGADGSVASRLEVPFERMTLVRPGVVTVVRGDSLWNIARSRYGDGLRYTVIYEANKGQIKDPDLIYPGQTFVIPKTVQ